MSFQNVQGVKSEPYSIIGTGRTTVSGADTPTPLAATSTPCKGVYVSADPTAGKHIAVGDSNVGSSGSAWRGTIIYPGHPGVFLLIDDVNKVYFSGAEGAVACYTYYF